MATFLTLFFSLAALSTAVYTMEKGVIRSLFHGRNRDGKLLRRDRLSWFRFSGPLVFAGGAAFNLGWGGEWYLGLLPPIFGLFAYLLVERYQSFRAAVEWEAYSLLFLRALMGLLEGGMGLPSALFLLAERLPGRYAARLQWALRRFVSGKTSLGESLWGFREKNSLYLTDLGWRAVEIAYDRGLSALALLRLLLPSLEADFRLQIRISELRRGAMFQWGGGSRDPLVNSRSAQSEPARTIF